jgi:hypothetical protein
MKFINEVQNLREKYGIHREKLRRTRLARESKIIIVKMKLTRAEKR